MKNFHHRGSCGDIVYSIPTIIALGGGKLYLRKENQFKFLYNLLARQNPHISYCFLEDGTEKIDINLDEFRPVSRNSPSLHLCQCHADPHHAQINYENAWLVDVYEDISPDIVINWTPRYHDKCEIDYTILKSYQDKCCFVGMQKDHENFCRKYNLKIEYVEVSDALYMAQVIKGSSLFIGNQSLGFALAESMKVPRVLERYFALDNCRPTGKNGYETLTADIIDRAIYCSEKECM